MGGSVGGSVGGAVGTVDTAVGSAVILLRTFEVPVGGLVEVGREWCAHFELSLGFETFRTVLCCIVLYCVSYSII